MHLGHSADSMCSQYRRGPGVQTERLAVHPMALLAIYFRRYHLNAPLASYFVELSDCSIAGHLYLVDGCWLLVDGCLLLLPLDGGVTLMVHELQ